MPDTASLTRRTSPGLKGTASGLPQHVGFQHQVADLLFELPDLFVPQRLVVLGPAAQRVLGPQEEPLLPVLDLRDGEPVGKLWLEDG